MSTGKLDIERLSKIGLAIMTAAVTEFEGRFELSSAFKASGLIDTHQHILPPTYAAWLDRLGVTDGGKPIPKWSLVAALDQMEKNGVAAAILSVSTPGMHLGDDKEARIQAREANLYMAELAETHSPSFGFLAALTLPDIDGAINEAVYALDVLKADGVLLLASAGGRYLGDPAWDPLMTELDRRNATILVHPSYLPGPEAPGIPGYAADFLLDTTRAAINIAKSGCLERFGNLKIILSHAGGFVPYAAERLAHISSPDGTSVGGIARLKRFFFDTALSSSPYALPSLLSFAEPSHITYGSDWPFATTDRSTFFRRQLDDFPLTLPQRRSISRGNAELLFPRFRVRTPQNASLFDRI